VQEAQEWQRQRLLEADAAQRADAAQNDATPRE
jgi:hypothetical protein